MNREPYVKPGVNSSEAFTLTSQGCNVNQQAGYCDRIYNIIWDQYNCNVEYKGVIEWFSCQPPPIWRPTIIS